MRGIAKGISACAYLSVAASSIWNGSECDTMKAIHDERLPVKGWLQEPDVHPHLILLGGAMCMAMILAVFFIPFLAVKWSGMSLRDWLMRPADLPWDTIVQSHGSVVAFMLSRPVGWMMILGWILVTVFWLLAFFSTLHRQSMVFCETSVLQVIITFLRYFGRFCIIGPGYLHAALARTMMLQPACVEDLVVAQPEGNGKWRIVFVAKVGFIMTCASLFVQHVMLTMWHSTTTNWVFYFAVVVRIFITALTMYLNFATSSQLFQDVQHLIGKVRAANEVLGADEQDQSKIALKDAEEEVKRVQFRWGIWLSFHFVVYLVVLVLSLLTMYTDHWAMAASGIPSLVEAIFCLVLQIIPLADYNKMVTLLADDTDHFVIYRAVKDLKTLHLKLPLAVTDMVVEPALLKGIAVSGSAVILKAAWDALTRAASGSDQ